jgi:hypothetical protein
MLLPAMPRDDGDLGDPTPHYASDRPANQMILSTLARRRFRRFATEQQNGSTAGATDSSPARREASAGNKEQTN